MHKVVSIGVDEAAIDGIVVEPRCFECEVGEAIAARLGFDNAMRLVCIRAVYGRIGPGNGICVFRTRDWTFTKLALPCGVSIWANII